jgi:hypothetical protein
MQMSTYTCPGVMRDRKDPYHISPTCSYCGSISQEAFLAAVEAGLKVTPTDKNYKMYVEIPNDTPDALRIVGGSNGKENPIGSFGKSATYCKLEKDMTKKEFKLAKNQGWLVEARKKDGHDKTNWICFGPAGAKKHGKFYFYHLDDEGKKRFIELHNNRTMNLAYPGYLYQKPFFAERKEPDIGEQEIDIVTGRIVTDD